MGIKQVKTSTDKKKIEKQSNKSWRKSKVIKSQVENYLSAIQDQKLSTPHLNSTSGYVNNIKDIRDVITDCTHTLIYRPLKHNEVTKTVLKFNLFYLQKFY